MNLELRVSRVLCDDKDTQTTYDVFTYVFTRCRCKGTTNPASRHTEAAIEEARRGRAFDFISNIQMRQ